MPDSLDIKVGVLRIEGTNCEDESALAFSSLGCDVEKIHLKQLLGDVDKSKQRNIMDYDAQVCHNVFLVANLHYIF